MFSSSTTFSSATLLKRSRHDGTRRDSNTPARYSQSVQATFELETASLLLSNGQVIPPDATHNHLPLGGLWINLNIGRVSVFTVGFLHFLKPGLRPFGLRRHFKR